MERSGTGSETADRTEQPSTGRTDSEKTLTLLDRRVAIILELFIADEGGFAGKPTEELRKRLAVQVESASEEVGKPTTVVHTAFEEGTRGTLGAAVLCRAPEHDPQDEETARYARELRRRLVVKPSLMAHRCECGWIVKARKDAWWACGFVNRLDDEVGRGLLGRLLPMPNGAGREERTAADEELEAALADGFDSALDRVAGVLGESAFGLEEDVPSIFMEPRAARRWVQEVAAARRDYYERRQRTSSS